jgi:RNA polymerase sigma factor (sigma-70 family)
MSDVTTIESPFVEEPGGEASDAKLASAAVGGDRDALELLIARHQPWIYNMAFRMVMVPEEAEDVTQDVLVKIITKLSSYDPQKSAFRTWLYRVVTNHILNMKTRGYEAHITGFDAYYSFVEQVPDQEPDDTPEMALITEDLKIGCVMGSLLCLNRTQRLAFILTVGFGATDVVGGELMDMTPDAFRKTLSRARGKLREFVGGNCGLVNPEAPCRCRNKVKTFVDSGAYSADRLNFLAPNRPRMKEIVGEVEDRFQKEVFKPYEELFRSHPFFKGPDVVSWLQKVLQDPEVRNVIEMN